MVFILENEWIINLNNLQLGRYAEYLVKMEFTRFGNAVYSSEIDDRGIDFVVCIGNRYYEVQVKSSRNFNYIYFSKNKFVPRDNLLAAVVLFLGEEKPAIFLIPSTRWNRPDKFFASKDYLNKKTRPEWGLNLSKRNLSFLRPYSFDSTVENLFN